MLGSMDLAPTEIVFSFTHTTDDRTYDTAGQYSYLQGPVKVPGPWKRGRPKAAKPKKAAFEFVSVSGKSRYMDSGSQSTIRSHARRMTPRHKISPAGQLSSPFKRPIAIEKCLPPPEVALRGVDPFDTSCITLEPYMHDLLSIFSSRIWKSIYSLEDVGGWNPIENYWLPLAFQDPALLHSFIACADAYVNGYMPEQKGSGRHEHWRTHMKGLKVLIELYGGIETLDSEPLVLHKIYRADLYGSLDAGEPPFFHGPNDITSTKYPTTNIRSEGLTAICRLLNFEPVLLTCIRQLEGVEKFWSKPEDLPSQENVPGAALHGLCPSALEIAQVRLTLTNTQYKLVLAANSPPAHLGSMGMAIFEILRITLVIYTLTILKERPQSTFIGQRIALKLYQALVAASEEASSADDLQLHPCGTESTLSNKVSNPMSPVSRLGSIMPSGFILWAIFFAIVNLPPGNESLEVISIKMTLLKIFAQLVQASGMNQRDVMFQFSKYLWIDNAHNTLFDHFWSQAEL
ncbi:unnamed protein product [Clonostachys rosea]|uniref:Transcription factor domain-containing protein n=1 Tax=Bionectria ochroleuca TaxID=29856 RepID=A0ABY6UGZ8_BIOOC|nr:unnamed protein product [Clonostachys rosea]